MPPFFKGEHKNEKTNQQSEKKTKKHSSFHLSSQEDLFVINYH